MTNLKKLVPLTERNNQPTMNMENGEVTAVNPIQPNTDADVIAVNPIQPDEDADVIAVNPIQPDEDADVIAVNPIQPDEDADVTAVHPIQPDEDADVNTEVHEETAEAGNEVEPDIEPNRLDAMMETLAEPPRRGPTIAIARSFRNWVSLYLQRRSTSNQQLQSCWPKPWQNNVLLFC